MAKKMTHVRRPERYITREENKTPLRRRIDDFVQDHSSLALDDSFDRRQLADAMEDLIKAIINELNEWK